MKQIPTLQLTTSDPDGGHGDGASSDAYDDSVSQHSNKKSIAII